MKNRRGFLLAEETLKIVVAVICIGFLIYFLTALYFNSQDKADLELAKSSLNYLTEQIIAGNSEAEIYNPNGWVITSWPNDYITGSLFWKQVKNGKPLACENVGWASCICICKENNPDNCDDKGICLENSKGLLIDDMIKIENPPIVLQINYDDRTITKNELG